MKALVLKKIALLEPEEIPPPPGPFLKINSCSICRTDAKMWQSGQRDLALPRIPGHEICVSDESGRSYVLWPGSACGKCRFCLEGRENLCPEMKILGFHTDGGFAEYVSASPSSMIEVPESVKDLRTASLAEPLGCVLNSLDRHKFREKEKFLVCGAGTLGVMASYAAASSGAFVTLLEKNPAKIEKCRRLFKFPGSVEITDNPEESFFDSALNAAPGLDAFSSCLRMLGARGSLLFFSGITPSDAVIPAKTLNEIHYRELKLEGSYGCTLKNMKDALSLIAENETFFSSLIERTISLEQVEAVLPSVLSGDNFKFVIDPAL